jgi:hypothetical protein
VRREYLDRILFWNQSDLERKLDDYKTYYNENRCHTGLAGTTPAQRCGAPSSNFYHAVNPGRTVELRVKVVVKTSKWLSAGQV